MLQRVYIVDSYMRSTTIQMESIFAFPWQLWLRESTTILRYSTHVFSLSRFLQTDVIVTHITPLPFPFLSCSIHYLLITPSFDTYNQSYRKASLNKPKINNYNSACIVAFHQCYEAVLCRVMHATYTYKPARESECDITSQ